MSRPATDAELRAAIDHVVNRYCEVFEITDLEERADIITPVLVLFERGVTDEVNLMAKLLESDEADRSSAP